MLSASVIWSKALAALKSEMTDASYNTWIATLVPLRIEGDTTLVLQTEDELYRSTLERFYTPMVEKSIRESCGCELHVRFTTRETPLDDDVAEASPDFVKPVTVRNDCPTLIPKYTFDTFVTGESNRFSYAAALAVAENPSKAYNPLYIYGGVGLGKTHLMHSIAHYIIEHDENSKVLYVTSEEFTNELIETIRNGNNSAMSKFREKYRNIDVLLVDDIQFIIGKESTQEEFFHTFNSLHSAKKQIIISSDKPPKDMEILEERFRSRFEWGLIADITLPDYETRMAILHKKEEMEGYNISEEVIKYIATNIKSNIRELEGAFNKVMASSKLEKKEVTLELAEQALKDIISPNEQKVITPDYIISVVAEHYHVTVADLCGNKRSSKIVMPRQISMYLCRDIIDTSLKTIGKNLGDRDHTTVMHGIEKIENELKVNDNLKNSIETLKKKINPQG